MSNRKGDIVEKLFIIGNGFDIAHDLKTDYLYFKKFVYQQAYGKDELLESLQNFDSIKDFLKYSDNRIYKSEIYAEEVMETLNSFDSQAKLRLLYQILLHITDKEKFWGDFEEKLACFPFMNASTPYHVTNDSKEDTESRKELAKEVADKLSKYVHHQLNKLFKQWIKETYELWKSQLSMRKFTSYFPIAKETILINRDARFLNFNYTRTLEDFYGIPSSNIIHIHGDLDDGVLIFGHGEDSIVIPEGADILSQAMYRLSAANRKPVHKRIRKYDYFFKSLSSIKEIYFIGFGIRDENGVDAPYFKEIFKQTPDVSIYVDQFDKENEYTIKKILKAWGARKAYQLQFIDTDKDELVGGVI